MYLKEVFWNFIFKIKKKKTKNREKNHVNLHKEKCNHPSFSSGFMWASLEKKPGKINEAFPKSFNVS
jgi:hypothetical protein